MENLDTNDKRKLSLNEIGWRGLTYTLSAVIVFLLTAILFFIARGALFTPFGDYPTQEVIAPKVDGLPQVSLSKDAGVTMRAVKCTHFPVETSGGFSWFGETDTHEILVVPGSVGSSQRNGTCEVLQFVNSFPSKVVAGVWQIRGTETAYGTNGETATRTWQTERFRIVE